MAKKTRCIFRPLISFHGIEIRRDVAFLPVETHAPRIAQRIVGNQFQQGGLPIRAPAIEVGIRCRRIVLFAPPQRHTGKYGDRAPAKRVHAGRTQIVRHTLARLDAALPKPAFLRIHRRTIVRFDRILEFRLASHGDGEILLSGDTRLRVSRRYRGPLDAAFAGAAASS